MNGLNDGLLTHNPNSAQPFRLSSSQAETCDQDHNYTDEQKAFDSGLMDKFVETVGVAKRKVGLPGHTVATPCDYSHGKGLVMGYYDGNTVTALWNYAQNFAMSDNSYSTNFGPSTPGALNLVSGQTHGVDASTRRGPRTAVTSERHGHRRPAADSGRLLHPRRRRRSGQAITGKNVGDLLNAKGVTWGWFQGGFRQTSGTSSVTGLPTTNTCQIGHSNQAGVFSADYIPHHEPFQYYRSTQNPHHLPPTSVAMIGKTDQANHQYDLSDFWAAVDAGNLPAVSFLKAPGYQDGHAGYSGSARRADVPRQHDQPAPAEPGLEEHGGHHRLRRLGRLVRPPDGPDRQPVERRLRRAPRRHRLRHERGRHAGGYLGPLRLRPAPAAARDLAVRQVELRRPHA